MNPTAIMFTGVNEGYQGDSTAIKDPAKAAEIALQTIDAVKRTVSGGDSNQYKAFPGVVVYERERGCPEGGEPVAVISTEGDAKTAIKTGELLRQKLRQATLSVATYGDIVGTPTLAFKATVKGDLKTVATAWQETALEYSKTQNMYISVGLYNDGNGNTVIQAEANPAKFQDINKWGAMVEDIAADTGKKLNITITPEFRDAGYTYLREQDKKTQLG